MFKYTTSNFEFLFTFAYFLLQYSILSYSILSTSPFRTMFAYKYSMLHKPCDTKNDSPFNEVFIILSNICPVSVCLSICLAERRFACGRALVTSSLLRGRALIKIQVLKNSRTHRPYVVDALGVCPCRYLVNDALGMCHCRNLLDDTMVVAKMPS